MGKANFDRLMKKWLTGEVSHEEHQKIEALLDMMKAENPDHTEMTDEEAEMLYQKIISKQTGVKEIRSLELESFRKRQRTRWAIRIAAGLVLAIAVTFVVWDVSNPDSFKIPTLATNDIHKVILNDGSLVWVRGESKLTYYEKEDGRYVDLKGEAFFEVAKDATRPFIIRHQNVSVRVVGTSFNLKMDGSVDLKVLTGSVNLSVQGEQELNVTPFEHATYSVQSGLNKSVMPREEVIEIVAGTGYDMQFVNATMDEVVGRLEKKFDVTINLANTDIKACHVTLDITDHSLDNSLKMIQAILNVDIEESGKVITISGTGCK